MKRFLNRFFTAVFLICCINIMVYGVVGFFVGGWAVPDTYGKIEIRKDGTHFYIGFGGGNYNEITEKVYYYSQIHGLTTFSLMIVGAIAFVLAEINKPKKIKKT